MTPFLRGAVAAAFVLPLAAGCAGFTPTEASLLEAGNAAACSALSLIPDAGALLVAACPGEEKLVDDAIASATLDGGAADASTGSASAAMVSASRASTATSSPRTTSITAAPGDTPAVLCARAAKGSPLFHRRGHARRHVGCCPVELLPAAQAHLDARPEAP